MITRRFNPINTHTHIRARAYARVTSSCPLLFNLLLAVFVCVPTPISFISPKIVEFMIAKQLLIPGIVSEVDFHPCLPNKLTQHVLRGINPRLTEFI